jgi:hypothetical protein
MQTLPKSLVHAVDGIKKNLCSLSIIQEADIKILDVAKVSELEKEKKDDYIHRMIEKLGSPHPLFPERRAAAINVEQIRKMLQEFLTNDALVVTLQWKIIFRQSSRQTARTLTMESLGIFNSGTQNYVFESVASRINIPGRFRQVEQHEIEMIQKTLRTSKSTA